MKERSRKELFIIAGMLIAALVAIFVLSRCLGGTKVYVTVAGKEYGVYELNTDTEVEIISDKGLNVLKIENGQAKVISASCPDKICVHTYPVSEDTPGIIVCLPNEVVIELR